MKHTGYRNSKAKLIRLCRNFIREKEKDLILFNAAIDRTKEELSSAQNSLKNIRGQNETNA